MARLAFQCLHLLVTHLSTASTSRPKQSPSTPQHSSKPLAALKAAVEAAPESVVAPLVPAMLAVVGRLGGVAGCEEEVRKLREALGWRFGEEIFATTGIADAVHTDMEEDAMTNSPSKEEGVRRSERKRRRSTRE